MDSITECIMAAAFCAAVADQLYCICRKNMPAQKSVRFILITTGVGFAFGAAKEFVRVPFSGAAALYLLGMMLSYITILFSIPEIKKNSRQ